MEFVLDDADDVFVDVLPAAARLADAGVDGGDAGPAEKPFLGLARGGVHLGEREIAAGVDIHQAVFGLDIGEELDARAVLRVAVLDADQEPDGEDEHRLGEGDGLLHDRHIEPVGLALGMGLGLGEHGAERRRENECEEHRGRQGDDQRQRQELHELADDARPEQEGREGRDAGHGRGDDRAGHAVGRKLEGGALVHAFRHAPLGELGDDDGIVDEHADGKDQAEQHDHVDRVAHQRQRQDAHQERGGDGEADQQRGAARQCVEDDDEDQDHRDQDMVLQVAQELADHVRLVLAVGDVDGNGQRLLERAGDDFHLVHRVDQVGAGALLDLDGDGGAAVETGDRLGFLEGGADGGEVLRAHDGIGAGDDRQVGDVLDGLDQRGDLDRVAALGALKRAGGDEAVAGIDALDHLVELEPVGGELDGVDDDVDLLVAGALQCAFENAGDFLDAVAQFARGLGEDAFGQVAGQRDDEDREFGNVDLVDGRLVDALRQFAPRVGHLGADVLERVGEIVAGLKLDQHEAAALIGRGAHLLDAGQALHLHLDGAQQKPLRILRRDALIGKAHIDDRDRDVGLGLLRDRLVGQGPRHDQEEQDRDRQAGIVDGDADDVHVRES